MHAPTLKTLTQTSALQAVTLLPLPTKEPQAWTRARAANVQWGKLGLLVLGLTFSVGSLHSMCSVTVSSALFRWFSHGAHVCAFQCGCYRQKLPNW